MRSSLGRSRARSPHAGSGDGGLEIRNFQTADLAAYTAMYNIADAANPDFRRSSPEEIRRRLLEDPLYQPRGHFVAVEAGNLVASARGAYYPENVKARGPESHLEMFVLPASLGKRVERELFSRVVEYLRSVGAQWIVTRVDTRFTAMVRLLERLGFSKSEYQNHGMERSTRDLSVPCPPDGYRIRVAKIPDEIETLHKVLNEGFSTREKHVPMPLDRFRRNWIFEDPSNHPGVFLAERAADGRPVGMVMSGIDRKSNEEHGTKKGSTFGLAVAPLERERGLGSALLLASAKWIADQGMETAYLSVNISNLDALRIYQKAGYETVQVYQGYKHHMS